MIPSSRALLNRNKRLPLDTWNQSGVQENVFGNQFSTFGFASRISSENVHRNREAIPHHPKVKASLTSGDGPKYGTIPMPTFASRPLTTSYTIPVEVPPNYVVGQQRQQMSKLQIRQLPYSRIFLGVEDPIRNTGSKWFSISVGSFVVCQRIGDG